MINHYELTLLPPPGQTLFSGWAYRLYSWLLSQLSPEEGERFHSQAEHPISQYLCIEQGKAVWHISLLNEEAYALFSPVLDTVESMGLRRGTVFVSERRQFSTEYRDLALSSQDNPSQIAVLQLLTPMAFKQGGRYVAFPQERLILQSLLNRWNAFSGDYPIEDDDAIRMLERGIHFGDYTLRSQRYPLKATSIPGFMGELTMISRLPAPMQELWTALLRFAPYSGIGIKTALGMGGIRIQ